MASNLNTSNLLKRHSHISVNDLNESINELPIKSSATTKNTTTSCLKKILNQRPSSSGGLVDSKSKRMFSSPSISSLVLASNDLANDTNSIFMNTTNKVGTSDHMETLSSTPHIQLEKLLPVRNVSVAGNGGKYRIMTMFSSNFKSHFQR